MARSITVSRTSLGLIPIAAAGNGHSGAVVVAWDPGTADPVNEYAESADLSGASLARTRLPLLTAALTLRLYASSEAAVRALADTWQQALQQPQFTLTEAFTGGSRSYTCCPAAVSRSLVGVELNQGTMLLTASIPRQP